VSNAGACYHVMARGNRRESALFLKAEKKRGQPFIIAPLQEKGRSERWHEPCRWHKERSHVMARGDRERRRRLQPARKGDWREGSDRRADPERINLEGGLVLPSS
jgi:hypothetical protein